MSVQNRIKLFTPPLPFLDFTKNTNLFQEKIKYFQSLNNYFYLSFCVFIYSFLFLKIVFISPTRFAEKNCKYTVVCTGTPACTRARSAIFLHTALIYKGI